MGWRRPGWLPGAPGAWHRSWRAPGAVLAAQPGWVGGAGPPSTLRLFQLHPCAENSLDMGGGGSKEPPHSCCPQSGVMADFWECCCSGERLLHPGAGKILPGMFRELCHGHFPPWRHLGGSSGTAQDGLWPFLGFFLLSTGDWMGIHGYKMFCRKSGVTRLMSLERKRVGERKNLGKS